MVPLAKGGATVGTSPLTQRKAEEDAQREKEYGAQDAQAGEVVLQDSHPASRAASHHHYRGLDDGVSRCVGLLGNCRAHLSRRVSWAIWVVVGRRGRCGDGPVAVRRRLLLRAVLMSPRNGVVGGRSVLKERLAVHHLTRRSVSLAYLVFCRAPKVKKKKKKTAVKNYFDYLIIVKRNAVG